MSPHHYVTDYQGQQVSHCKHNSSPYHPTGLGLPELSGMASQAMPNSSGNQVRSILGAGGNGRKARGLWEKRGVNARAERGRGSWSGKNHQAMGGSDEKIVELSP